MNIIKNAFVNSIINSYLIPNRVRVMLYKYMGLEIQTNRVRPKCFFNSERVSIGENSFVNYFCQFHSSVKPQGTIKIGENCYIGMNTNICTITHEHGNEHQRAGKNTFHPIIIGDGVWIGANSLILPGVTIGSGCIIAAGSVVVKDCECNCLYAGNPATKIKNLPVNGEKTTLINVV